MQRQREMCSCEGVCISVVVRGFAGKSVSFDYPFGSAVHYGQQVVIVARAWLKYAPVTSLARGRRRVDSLWWRSKWQEDWRSCPARFDSMLCAVATRCISFSQSRSVAPRINLRNTWMCIGVHFVVFHWLHDYQFSCSRSFFLPALCTRWSEVLGQMHTNVKTTDVCVGGLVCRVGARRPRCTD